MIQPRCGMPACLARAGDSSKLGKLNNLKEPIVTAAILTASKLSFGHGQCRLRNNETPFLSSNDEMMAPAKDRMVVVHNFDGGTCIPGNIVDIFKKGRATPNMSLGSAPPPSTHPGISPRDLMGHLIM